MTRPVEEADRAVTPGDQAEAPVPGVRRSRRRRTRPRAAPAGGPATTGSVSASSTISSGHLPIRAMPGRSNATGSTSRQSVEPPPTASSVPARPAAATSSEAAAAVVVVVAACGPAEVAP